MKTAKKERSVAAPAALVFDWDNTLIDTWTLLHEALNFTFKEFGLPEWSHAETRERVRQSAREAFPRLFGEKTDDAIRCYLHHYQQVSSKQLKSLPGSGEFLMRSSKLGRGPLSVVSNKTGDILRQEAQRLAWNDYFHALVGAGDAARDKPSPEPVALAINGSGLSLGPEIWFIGDTDIDLLCARNAGCTGVLLRMEAPDDGEFLGCEPAFHVNDFAGLEQLLTQHGFFNCDSHVR